MVYWLVKWPSPSQTECQIPHTTPLRLRSAWQIVRAVPEIPTACKALVDSQYEQPFPIVSDRLTLTLTLALNAPLPSLSTSPSSPPCSLWLQHLPFHAPGGSLPELMLYRVFGHTIDKHPNVAGQYLNALTFYAALFGKVGDGPCVSRLSVLL